MPKFTVKDLMITTTLVAVGLGIAIVAFNSDGSTSSPYVIPPMFCLYELGCSLAGLGVMFPVKRRGWLALGFVTGALIGFLVILVIAFVAYTGR